MRRLCNRGAKQLFSLLAEQTRRSCLPAATTKKGALWTLSASQSYWTAPLRERVMTDKGGARGRL